MTSAVTHGKTKIWLAWFAFTLVMLVAAFFRFYHLGDHPLGLYFDPAINGLDAIRLLQRGGYVLFFPTNGGRESLFIILLVPFIWLLNTTPAALHTLTGIISLLNVAFLFGFLRSLSCLNFGQNKTIDSALHYNNLWFTTLSSMTLAVSYWHISTTRLGVRAVLVALLSVPIFWFFLKGWNTRQKRWFFFAGIIMGLEGYTYSAARLLPIILILAVLPEFFLQPGQLKKQFKNLIIFVSVAVIVFLPMARYLLTHPAQFTARAGSVMVWNFLDTPANITNEVGKNIVRVFGFFCCTGSPNAVFGLPGWPGLPPLLAPFLLIGLILAIKNWRHIFYRLVVIWWLIGIFPSIIAIEAPHPLRMIVAVVPTAILVGLGLVYTFQWLRDKVSSVNTHHSLRTTFYILPFLLILATIPGTYRAYFIDWTQRQDTQGVYDYGAIAIRDTVFNHSDDDTPIYLPLARFNDSTLLYYLSGSFDREAKTSAVPASRAVVISPEKNEQDAIWVRLQNGTATVLPPLMDEGQHLIQVALTGNSTPIRTTSGETIARMATLPTDPARFLQQPTRSLDASFGPVRLTGVNYQMAIDPSTGKLPVTLFWQATETMSNEYEVIVQLVDDNRRVWGDGSGRPNDWVYPTSFWRPEFDEVASQQIIKLESNNLPPGRYRLAVSLLDPAAQQRLPLTKGASDSPDTFFIGPLKVPLPPPESTPPSIEPVDFDDVARLVGLEVNPQTIIPGESIKLALLWQALDTPKDDYTVFVHLLDKADNLVIGNDAQPLNGLYPTSIWAPGEKILDSHTLPTSNTMSAGLYKLAIGLYHQPTGQRLSVNYADGSSDPDDRLILPTQIIVK